MYALTMKWQALIVLVAIALSIVIPPSLPFLPGHRAMVAIGTIDVCHSAMPAVSGNGDMPCMHECLCGPLPPELYNNVAIPNPLIKPFAISYQDERPPKV